MATFHYKRSIKIEITYAFGEIFSRKFMNIILISLEDSDGNYYVVFIDDKIYNQGDSYHNQVTEEIYGAMKILDYLKIKYDYKRINFEMKNEDKEMWEFSYIPKIDDNPVSYVAQIQEFMKVIE